MRITPFPAEAPDPGVTDNKIIPLSVNLYPGLVSYSLMVVGSFSDVVINKSVSPVIPTDMAAPTPSKAVNITTFTEYRILLTGTAKTDLGDASPHAKLDS
jgi:hypothetical protein